MRGRPRVWTTPTILEALKDWNREHGRPPRMLEWQDKAPGRPTSHTVIGIVGSWNKALDAAGLPTIAPQGGRPH